MELSDDTPGGAVGESGNHAGTLPIRAEGTHGWASRFWANEGQAGLQFASADALDAAIDWLWSSAQLREMPRVHVGLNTMIVPEAAVDLFRQKGYDFTLRKVMSAGELPPDEVNRIRREG